MLAAMRRANLVHAAPPPHPVYKGGPEGDGRTDPARRRPRHARRGGGDDDAPLPGGRPHRRRARPPPHPPAGRPDLARAGPARHRPAALRDRRPPAGAARQRGRRAHGRLPRRDPHRRLPARPAAPPLARPARLPGRADGARRRGRVDVGHARRQRHGHPRRSAPTSPEPARAGTVALSLPDGEVVAPATLVTAAPGLAQLPARPDRAGGEPAARVSLVLAYHRAQLRGG